MLFQSPFRATRKQRPDSCIHAQCLFLEEPSQHAEHTNPQGGAGFLPRGFPPPSPHPLFSLGGRRAVPRVPSKFTSATGSWCNALLGASAHTTGCDSGLRDVSQFPGRCVRASPGDGSLASPCLGPPDGRGRLPWEQKGVLLEVPVPSSESGQALLRKRHFLKCPAVRPASAMQVAQQRSKQPLTRARRQRHRSAWCCYQ